MGPKLKIFANQSCDVSKFAREGHLANKKNHLHLQSKRKIQKNYQLGQFRKKMTKTALISSFFLFFSQMVSQMVVRFFHWRIAILAQILIGHTIGLQKKLILAPFSEKFFFPLCFGFNISSTRQKIGENISPI